jgi:hypothetical protein
MESPLSDESLIEEIAAAFPSTAEVIPDAVIEANPDIFSLQGPVDFRVVVPAYISWCVRHATDGRGTLVPDYTVHALAEFGRSKDSSIAHLNFKHTCSLRQRAAVASFLHWCLNPDLILNKEQIKRALKNWAESKSGGANAV